MPAYGEADYWDERYQREPTCFDWYQKWPGLESILKQHVPTSSRILHLGVGTSLLQADMVQEGGYSQIVNLDVSRVAIEQMQQLHSSIPQLQYQLGDARSMPEFGDSSFDVVLEKGTLDAILCGEHASANSTSMLLECHRVLKPNGVMIVITYGEPAARLPLLLQAGLRWHVLLYVLEKPPEAAVSDPGSLAPIIQGPFDLQALEMRAPFAAMSTVHFVYVCLKTD